MNNLPLHLIILVIVYGIVAPYLVSAKSNELAVGGIALMIFTGYFYLNKVTKFLKEKE